MHQTQSFRRHIVPEIAPVPRMLPDELDVNEVYRLFTESYLDATGSAQPMSWFEDHFWTWEYYGNESGMVAIRHQGNGLIKITGAAGNPRGVSRGLCEVLRLDQPVWTAVSTDLLPQVQRLGLIEPPKLVVKTLVRLLGQKFSRGRPLRVNRDGSITATFENLGDVTKHFVANRKYYSWLLTVAPVLYTSERIGITGRTVKAIKSILAGLVSEKSQ